MAGIKSVTKGIRGNTLLGNIIILALLERVIRGDKDEISVSELALACDTPEDSVRSMLQHLTSLGKIALPTLEDWSEIDEFSIGTVRVEVCPLQNHLPEVESPKIPSLEDLLECDSVIVECGEEAIAIDDGNDSHKQPIVFRIGIALGQESDTLELNVIRQVSELHIGETITVEGIDGQFAKVIEGKIFGPPTGEESMADVRASVVEFLKEALEPYNPTESQRKALGMPDISADTNVEIPLFNQEHVSRVIEYAREHREVSTSSVQRLLEIGINEASALLDEVESQGYISRRPGGGPRVWIWRDDSQQEEAS